MASIYPTQSEGDLGEPHVAVVSSQYRWILENREVASEALSALSREPISAKERNRLVHLLESLKLPDGHRNDVAGQVELAYRLSSPQCDWLPAAPQRPADDSTPLQAPPSESALPPESAPWSASTGSSAPTSQMLVAVAQAIYQRSHVGFHVALIYPLIVLGLAGLVLVWLSLIVVPSFESMFDEFGLTLPLPTRLVFVISQWIRLGWRFWLALVVLAALLVFAASQLRPWMAKLRLALGFRRRGSTSELMAMSRFIRTVAELVRANTPLADAVRLAGLRCQHPYYQQSAMLLAHDLQRSPGLPSQAASAARFPANVIVALKPQSADSGESTAANLPLLLTLAELYDERASGRVASGATVPGILAVAIVGCLVGFVALSLFMPLISLITGLS